MPATARPLTVPTRALPAGGGPQFEIRQRYGLYDNRDAIIGWQSVPVETACTRAWAEKRAELLWQRGELIEDIDAHIEIVDRATVERYDPYTGERVATPRAAHWTLPAPAPTPAPVVEGDDFDEHGLPRLPF